MLWVYEIHFPYPISNRRSCSLHFRSLLNIGPARAAISGRIIPLPRCKRRSLFLVVLTRLSMRVFSFLLFFLSVACCFGDGFSFKVGLCTMFFITSQTVQISPRLASLMVFCFCLELTNLFKNNLCLRKRSISQNECQS